MSDTLITIIYMIPENNHSLLREILIADRNLSLKPY